MRLKVIYKYNKFTGERTPYLTESEEVPDSHLDYLCARYNTESKDFYYNWEYRDE